MQASRKKAAGRADVLQGSKRFAIVGPFEYISSRPVAALWVAIGGHQNMKAVAWHAIRRKYWEPVAWTAVLAALYFMEPTAPSLCLFKAVGFSHCPGCGIGHAIHYALHGQLGLSWKAHWLGIPATGVMFWIVVKPFFSLYKKHALQHEPATAYDHSGPAA